MLGLGVASELTIRFIGCPPLVACEGKLGDYLKAEREGRVDGAQSDARENAAATSGRRSGEGRNPRNGNAGRLNATTAITSA
jgi:hypothetical protein